MNRVAVAVLPLAAVAAIALNGSAASQRVALTGAVEESSVVREAPIFSFPLIGASRRFGLQSARGKALVLTFWASYDAPFHGEASRLEQESKRWAAKGVLFVGIDVQDLAGDALATMRRYGITYPNVLDTNGTTLTSYGVAATPATVFVNRLGNLVGESVAGPASTAQLDSNIKLALASKAAATGVGVSVVAGKPAEFSFTLSKLSVPHGWVTFNLTNQGHVQHEFEVCASKKGGHANSCKTLGASAGILPEESTSLLVDFTSPGTYEFLCRITGHAAQGMKGVLKVS